MEPQNQSPKVERVHNIPESFSKGPMSFYQMLQSIAQNGSFATREAWNDEKQLVFMDRTLKIRLPKNNYQSVDWVVNDGDISAADWKIVL